MHFSGKIYGAVTVGKSGQVVIPVKLRKSLNIRPRDRLMVFVEIDKKIINPMLELL